MMLNTYMLWTFLHSRQVLINKTYCFLRRDRDRRHQSPSSGRQTTKKMLEDKYVGSLSEGLVNHIELSDDE